LDRVLSSLGPRDDSDTYFAELREVIKKKRNRAFCKVGVLAFEEEAQI
jgi:hypothetical protein